MVRLCEAPHCMQMRSAFSACCLATPLQRHARHPEGHLSKLPHGFQAAPASAPAERAPHPASKAAAKAAARATAKAAAAAAQKAAAKRAAKKKRALAAAPNPRMGLFQAFTHHPRKKRSSAFKR